MLKLIWMAALGAVLATPGIARAQQPALDFGGFDAAALMSGTQDVVRRAPDSSIDGLLQAVHASAQIPDEAKIICRLFEPDGDRSVQGFSAAANQLGDASRERFITAITEIAVAGLQGQPQPYDVAAARQALKSAGARAAILHDGFIAGLTANGNDAASRQARCQSLQWMLASLQAQPLAERAAATRLLLGEGLLRLQGGAR